MSLSVIDDASKLVGEAIFISGVARSGTTILGKAIHSMDEVEYAFEPSLLFSLIPLLNNFHQDDWKLLFETYLYEDFIINAIAGRSINCNKSDDSSIYRVKNDEDIENRLNISLSKVMAISMVRNKTLALKMPDMAPFFPKIKVLYPHMRMIVMRRNAGDVINSLMQKKWFSNEMLDQGLVWPFDNSYSVNIPFWVKKCDYDYWLGLTEIDRCAYYYIKMNENFNGFSNYTFINYDDLLENPSLIISNLASELGLSYGEKTKEIINSIHRTNSVRDISILSQVSISLREEMLLHSKF